MRLRLKKDNKILMGGTLGDVIGYLNNRDLINLTDKCFIDESNDWKDNYSYNKKYIFNHFNELTNNQFELEVLEK